MGNKDVVGRIFDKMPGWLQFVLATLLCGPFIFCLAVTSKDYKRHEFYVLNILGVISGLLWISSLLTLVGVVPVTLFGSSVVAAVVLWAISALVALGACYSAMVFLVPESDDPDGYGYFSGHRDLSDQSGYPNDQAEQLRREVGFSRRARAEAAFYNGASGSQAAS